MNRHTNKHTSRQTQTDNQTNRHTHRQTDRRINSHTCSHTCSHTSRHAERQNRQSGTRTDWQTVENIRLHERERMRLWIRWFGRTRLFGRFRSLKVTIMDEDAKTVKTRRCNFFVVESDWSYIPCIIGLSLVLIDRKSGRRHGDSFQQSFIKAIHKY